MDACDRQFIVRIVHVIASLIGGAAAQMTWLAQGQRAAGHNVQVLAPDDCASGRSRLEKLHVPWQVLPSNGLGAVRSLPVRLREAAPDVVHVHGQRAALWVRLGLLAKRHRPRLVYTLHGFHIPHYRWWWQRCTAALVERVLGAYCDRIICLTEEDRQAVIAWLARSCGARVLVVPNGIPAPLPMGDAHALCRMLGVPEEGPRIGTIARLHRQKAIDVLIRAFEIVARDFPLARLLIVGDGPLRSTLVAQAQATGFGDRIHWLGDRPDAQELLPVFDVFVMPSLWEGMSLALMEAMAAGRPVVATDVPGNRALVRDGETGLLVVAGDPYAMAGAAGKLLTDPATATRLADAAAAHCREHFDLRTMVLTTLQAYEGS